MSNLRPELIALDKGLNLQTAKIIAPPGSVLDTLNYEQVDFQGQKRIDGFVRYDGSLLAALDDYYKITTDLAVSPNVGELIATEEGGLFGIVVGSSGFVTYVAVVNYNELPEIDEDIVTLIAENGGVPRLDIPRTVTGIVPGIASGITPDQHYNNLLTFSAAMRARVEGLPGPVAGLHWFRDRLYAVAEVTTVSLGGTTPIIYPNDFVQRGPLIAKVLNAFTLTNSRILFLDAMDSTSWGVPGAPVNRDGIYVGSIVAGFEDFTVDEETASFFESRTEQQVVDEDGPSGEYDFGWRFVDLGWEVPFENGLSLYGTLASLNQNIFDLGVQGPTSINGNHGKPLLLSQKVSITNRPTQVNGWKNSTTPASYSLEEDNVETVDSIYVYADAYLSWDGTTGAVEAPGYTTATLTEYPANATVEVIV